MKRYTIPILALALGLNLSAAVPLKWTVETSRLQPVVFDVVHGETLALEATLQSYGKPLAMDGKVCSIFYQTNGMDQAWWTGSASATSNVISATFTPAMDPGAAVVNGFIGSTGEIYRAAFTLRFRKGPGAAPNSLSAPVQTIDFSKITVLNAPWEDFVGKSPEILSPTDEDGVYELKTVVNDDSTLGMPLAETPEFISLSEAVETVSNDLKSIKAFNTANTNVWFEATNYYETAGIPCSMQLYEIRDGETKLVWDQRKFEKYYTDEAVKAVTNRNDWSRFQSYTGAANPLTDTTWISTPKIAMAGGFEWQKNVTTKGAVFVLSSNGLVADLNPTNGSFLAVQDLEKNDIFAIRRTASQTLGASASAVTADGSSITVTYSVESDNHPTASVALTLTDGGLHFYEETDDDCPATVEWYGSSGAWVATITPKYTTTQIFAKATYTQAGTTVVDSAAPIKLPYLIVGDKKIKPVVTGTTVTWEVVQ